MEYLFDSANLQDIETYMKIYPITGVTSNPSILKAEGKIDFFAHMKTIRSLLDGQQSLHIQVIAQDAAGICREAEAILDKIGSDTHIKIPVTEEGLKAIRHLKAQGANITATGIYAKTQGFLAIACGADYIAPYYNRMENMDIDSCDTIASFRQMIEQEPSQTKIVAASFKNIAQVNNALLSGAHCVTVQPALLHEALSLPAIQKAVDDFHADWAGIQGDVSITDLT